MDEKRDSETSNSSSSEEEKVGRREEMVLVNYRKYQYVEMEPEWDVDSYDGWEYETDPEVRDFFSDEDRYQRYRFYRIETLKSKGFLPDEGNGIYNYCNLEAQVPEVEAFREVLTDLVSLCVKKFNEDKGKTVEMDSVVRANASGGARRKYYITFMAREYENGPLVEYQAKAMRYIRDYMPPFPILCRPSPIPIQ